MVKDRKIDKMLIMVTALLLLFGLIMIYSSTMILAKERFGDSFYFLKRQAIWLFLGIIITALISFFRYPYYLDKKVVYLVLSLAIIGLVAVFFTEKRNNSFRWIIIGDYSLQPSEFAKIAIVMYLSFIFSRKNYDVNNIKKLIIHLIPFFVMALLILKEPDLGNLFLILTIGAVLLFVAGLKFRYFFISALFVAPPIAWVIHTNPEKLFRILAFLNPEKYSGSYSFQALQSIYAIGSGGIFGKGLGNSTQKLFFLPYAYSDFIYAIVSEEIGLIGSIIVLGLFCIFLIRGINIAKLSGNLHTYLLVIGLSFLVVIQAMIHISVTIGIFPTKGIPLPFISSGGSSLIASLVITGIILNVSRHRKTVLLND
jgi:cell division protein FtsW